MADSSSSPPGQPPTVVSSETPAALPIVVKKYANRRLYNTETSSYITLDNLAEMIRAGRDFVVYDAKSGEDITRGVLTQIIVEEENKGTAMLPTGFLRQLIGFYGGNLQGVVPRYLEHAMSSFARQQQQMRQMMERTLSPFLPTGVEELNRQSMAIFDRALSMWNPFHRAESEPGKGEPAILQLEPNEREELERLRQELEHLRLSQAPSADPAELEQLREEVAALRRTQAPSVDQAELERLRAEVTALRQTQAPSADQAELEQLRKEVATLRETQAPSADQGELEQLREQVATLRQELAAAVVQATPAAPAEFEPGEERADTVSGSNGAAVKPLRRAGARPKAGPTVQS
jgi:polyhydroxyalkanoate synthesis repressor PhaR